MKTKSLKRPKKRKISFSRLSKILLIGAGSLIGTDYFAFDSAFFSMGINEVRYGIVKVLNKKEDKKIRKIKVTAAVDEEFLNLYNNNFDECRKVIDEVFKRTSKLYKKDFGIEFEVKKYDQYKSNDSLSHKYWRTLEAAYKINCDSNDLRIAFTGQNLTSLSSRLGGVAMELSNISVIYCPKHPSGNINNNWVISNLEDTVKHEIGHIFGAVHVKNRNYIMSEICIGWKFCDKNKEIIKKNKDRYFF